MGLEVCARRGGGGKLEFGIVSSLDAGGGRLHFRPRADSVPAMAESLSPAPPRGKRPWYSPVRLVQRFLIYVVVGYAALCGYLYLAQNSLEYPRAMSGGVLAPEDAIRQAKAVGLVPWDAAGLDSSAPQGYVPIDFTKPAPRGTIVVFHGNGGWAGERTVYVDAFERRGFRTFLYEYPGYGGRPGRPSERTLVPDARALIRSLDRAGDGPIYVWGESLGAGVAAAVCADPALPVGGLVLLTPWDTVANVGSSRYPIIPVKWLMADTYDSIANLEHFRHPICVIRSTRDEIIPPALTINLYAHLPNPKKLILQEGYGHEDWPSSPELTWWDDALNFIAPK
jgi:pimeloyl-ACP methyl ester carboxylesterase